jgi:hypothetical protein
LTSTAEPATTTAVATTLLTTVSTTTTVSASLWAVAGNVADLRALRMRKLVFALAEILLELTL